MENILFFLDFTFIYFLVLTDVELLMLVEEVPRFIEFVVSQYIGIIKIKL